VIRSNNASFCGFRFSFNITISSILIVHYSLI
jgi:hypothetical protein